MKADIKVLIPPRKCHGVMTVNRSLCPLSGEHLRNIYLLTDRKASLVIESEKIDKR